MGPDPFHVDQDAILTQSERSHSTPSLSVVVSFRNEADNLPELVKRLRIVLRQEAANGYLSWFELVFVNDASTDESEEILRREADAGGDIFVITMSQNFGVSQCVLAGMEYSRGDLVVYMDADLQDPPELIHEMLKVWRERGDVDVVNTVRLSRAGEHAIKVRLTRVGYAILKLVSDVGVIANAGDFKLLSRRVVSHMVRMHEKLPFVRGMVYWVGYKQANINYHRQARHAGKTHFPFLGRRVIHNFFFSALISFSSAPLLISVISGIITSVFAFCLFIYVIVQWFLLRQVTQGWTMIMATMALLGGVQLLTNGINGLYINTIFHEVKGRPLYIVDRTYGIPRDRVPPGNAV